MADRNPARALTVVKHIVEMCDFIEHPAIKNAVEQAVPVSMPRLPGALGFDIALWVGLGTVGLWAALDAFADRAGLTKSNCPRCDRSSCIWMRFPPILLKATKVRASKSWKTFAISTLTTMQARPTPIIFVGNDTSLPLARPHN
jgi:hypothetical protein